MIRTDDPFIRCVCGHKWQHGDAWELRAGSQVECPECGKTLECFSEDVSRSWTWGIR